MKKALKRTFALALALLLTAALAACGGTTSSSAPASSAAPVASSAPASGGATLEGTIEYWSMWNEAEPNGQVIKEAIDDFVANNPGVTVNITWQGREIRDTIKAALDGGAQVDIWDNSVQLIAADYKDYGIDLAELMAKDYPGTGGKPFEETVQPQLLQAVTDYSGGAVNAVPFQPNVLCMYFNPTHFEEAGITEMPETWEEFMDVCAKLKEAGHTPMSVDDGYVFLPFSMYLGRKAGVDYIRELVQTPDMWDDEVVLEAAKAIEAMAQNGYYPATVSANKYPAGQNEFADGTVSMYLVPSYMINEVQPITGPDFEFGAFMFPQPADATLPATADIYDCQAFQITKNCANPELAFALIAHICSPEWDAKMAETATAIPTLSDTPWPEALASSQEVFTSITMNLPWAVAANTNGNINPTFKANLLKLSGGELTAEQFVAEMKAAVAGG